MKKPYLIIVAGGSASGKSTVVKAILEKSGIKDCLTINQDDYYKNQDHMTMEERLLVNYDHPLSIDNDVLYQDLISLLEGKTILKPIYDYKNYTRSDQTETIEPKPIIILEGILSLTDKSIRNLADLKLYVESDDDLRLIRRIKRDVKERGRSLDSVVDQYLNTVKPMYHKYVKPTKRYADMIIPNDEAHQKAVDVIVGMLKSKKEELK
ncbi:Uridine kinase [Acholeplasma oculi]|uniref:Uridine kinase n=1 Tax=Acholeplasma oculi TaxID=35623 RepID=A0A061AHF8_9MOLU|nr:uridine kinase [Acholeplasma oculi]CDR30417.1 Uridine kinase [Acholeplasma oculi]SKC50395.1 uridine kinase [Acholeplasma oculi]SUT88978.1 Uridine kinase [Acholeplasma oculi]